MNAIVFVIVIAIVFSIFIDSILRKKILNRLTDELAKADYDTFFRDVDSVSSKYFISKFNREYMKLNALLIKGSKVEVKKQIEILENMSLDDDQKKKINLMAFQFYIDERNAKSRDYLKKLRNSVPEPIIHSCEILENIYVDNGYRYFNEVLESMNNTEGFEKGFNRKLISEMYKNKGDFSRAKIEFDKAQIEMQNK